MILFLSGTLNIFFERKFPYNWKLRNHLVGKKFSADGIIRFKKLLDY